MTMQLIIGIGVQFLQDLVASTSQTLDASQLGILLCAVIILAVISHRLPHMVAGMVVGGGHNQGSFFAFCKTFWFKGWIWC